MIESPTHLYGRVGPIQHDLRSRVPIVQEGDAPVFVALVQPRFAPLEVDVVRGDQGVAGLLIQEMNGLLSLE